MGQQQQQHHPFRPETFIRLLQQFVNGLLAEIHGFGYLVKAQVFKKAQVHNLLLPWRQAVEDTFYFYALIPLMALINISSRDFKLFPKNRTPGNVPFSC